MLIWILWLISWVLRKVRSIFIVIDRTDSANNSLIFVNFSWFTERLMPIYNDTWIILWVSWAVLDLTKWYGSVPILRKSCWLLNARVVSVVKRCIMFSHKPFVRWGDVWLLISTLWRFGNSQRSSIIISKLHSIRMGNNILFLLLVFQVFVKQLTYASPFFTSLRLGCRVLCSCTFGLLLLYGVNKISVSLLKLLFLRGIRPVLSLSIDLWEIHFTTIISCCLFILTGHTHFESAIFGSLQ